MPTYTYVQNASGEVLYADANGQPQGIDAITWNGTNLAVGATMSVTGATTLSNTGLHLLDTDSSHDLIIAPGSNLTADRTLTITTGDADRTLTISASATISGTNTGDVTLSGTPDYITIANQVITVGLVDLTADVTGDLPLANLAQASAASKLLGRGSAAGAGDYQEITLGTGLSMSGTTLSATGGSGSVATDTIWDAKGDLAVGTGADTAQKLTVGSDGKTIVADSTQTTGLAWKTRQTVVKDICGGRLSLESAVSVSSSDQSGKSTIYFVEHTSNEIALYDGTEWVPRTFNNISVAVPSTLFKVFDIFAYDNSGTVTLETTDWNQSTATVSGATNATPIVITTSSAHGFSNGDLVGVAGIGGNTAANGYIWEISSASGSSLTLVGSVGNGAYTSGGTIYKLTNTRATALTTQDGVLVKTGATTRRYLGTGMTGGTSGQMDDAVQKRMLCNYYNQQPRDVIVSYSTSHAYATNTTRLMNLAAANKVWFVLGQPQDMVMHVVNSADGSLAAVGAAVDSTTIAIQEFMTTSSGSLFTICGAVYKQGQAAGGHFIAMTERAANSTSVTFCVFSTSCRVIANLSM